MSEEGIIAYQFIQNSQELWNDLLDSIYNSKNWLDGQLSHKWERVLGFHVLEIKKILYQELNKKNKTKKNMSGGGIKLLNIVFRLFKMNSD